MPPAGAALPKVAVIGTGGTISSVGRDSLDLVDYTATGQKYQADELVERFPEVRRVADVTAVRFRAVSSTDIGVAEWLELVRTIHDVAASGDKFDGIVVTHGTATLEETAYFLNLTLKTDIPVVLVGAQRPASALGTDAGMNLLNAVRVAGSAQARGLGVLVLLNDEIHAARDVTKTSTQRLHTFRSPDFGILGHADGDGTVAFYRRPTRINAPDTEFEISKLDALPRVDIALSYAGADGAAVDAFVAAGARGIVAAGFAPGSCTKAQIDALNRARNAGVAVVQSTRAGSGRVATINTQRIEGAVSADNLPPQKARILLMLALTVSDNRDELTRMFAAY
ncbi:MAG: L-asparaginase 2 [Alphaproteobacteria bacterium MarineAlpha10_Bin3]|nr:MAG: L-asparaginase 2 [Alphaproteobacteria bacterium MarineAlpha10_Bin3]PPR69559.1 MAG: L-asparaginase 2 [Alphaproteobacteria bacterium MarineAlpha4_Bin1]